MKELIDYIKELDGFICSGAPSIESILAAEDDIGMGFADDYRLYVKTFGLVTAGKIALTGISFNASRSVSIVTRVERLYHFGLGDKYVIEIPGYDGTIIVQDSSGVVYKAAAGGFPVVLCDSLLEYLRLRKSDCLTDTSSFFQKIYSPKNYM